MLSVYLLCCFSRKFFSIGIDIKFDIWLNITCSRCFILIISFGKKLSGYHADTLITIKAEAIPQGWQPFSLIFMCLSYKACMYVPLYLSSNKPTCYFTPWHLSLSCDRNFIICFWINLVFEIVFDTCFIFDLICLF